MLIRFSISNFLSFNEETEISLVPGRTRKHAEHVVKADAWNGIDVLRSAVVYGANASGKSNLVKAFAFCQRLIVEGTKPNKTIDLPIFRFDAGSTSRPSRFAFEIKLRDRAFAYGFELEPARVISEWLHLITKTSNKPLFERKSSPEGQTTVEFGTVAFKDREERKFLTFVARGTRQNQLFLTESIDRGVSHFADVHKWFANSLTIIFPESQYRDLELEIETDEELRRAYELLLRRFDTGVSGIRYKNVDFDTDIKLPSPFLDEIRKSLQSHSRVVLRAPDKRRFVLHKTDGGRIQATELMTEHSIKGSHDTALLELALESDGTQRLLDIIPALFALARNERVFIIDELDRSLHPRLSRILLELFLKDASHTSSQLIVTTHETGLLDLKLLRRDEIWFVEKKKDGASSLYSLEEFTPRYDKDIRKGYLRGRFGAIPVVHDVSSLGWAK
jgi:hypothetical protein